MVRARFTQRNALVLSLVLFVAIIMYALWRGGYHKAMSVSVAPAAGGGSLSNANVPISSDDASRNVIIPKTPDASNKNGPRITKAPGYDEAEKIINIDLTGKSHAELERIYFGVAEQVHLNCSVRKRLGDVDDGGYNPCFVSPFDIRESKPCVAFSIGINYVWEYDDTLADTFNCKVYMFDPSMTNVTDHQRKKTSWFYRVGIANENRVEPNGWKLKTICTIINDLGYGDKVIDILKIDVEYAEWDSIERALKDGCLKNVKQLIFEAHTKELLMQKSEYARYINMWREIFKQGFRAWYFYEAPVSRYYPSASKPPEKRACCYEHYLLNTRFIEL